MRVQEQRYQDLSEPGMPAGNPITARTRTRFMEPRYLPLAVAKCIGMATQHLRIA